MTVRKQESLDQLPAEALFIVFATNSFALQRLTLTDDREESIQTFAG